MKISDAELEVMQVIWDKRRSNFKRNNRKQTPPAHESRIIASGSEDA